ncbi:putative valine--tRNA ligase [Helianthus annuus]|nr:putative valine--tRNA ligase [Helianthus annuus]
MAKGYAHTLWLWQRLPSPKDRTREESVMICEYPSVVESWTNDEIDYEMEVVESAVKSFRSIRGETKERYVVIFKSRDSPENGINVSGHVHV